MCRGKLAFNDFFFWTSLKTVQALNPGALVERNPGYQALFYSRHISWKWPTSPVSENPQITRITRIPKWSLDFPNVPLDSPNDLPREGTKQIVLFWGNFPLKTTITPSSFPPSGNLLLQDVPGNVFLKALLAPKCCPTDIARSCMRLLSGMRTHVGLQCCCTQYSLVTHKTL